ncbi:MAG: PhzF family phenazine biosynthesis protein, partial [Syntrophales bacterium]|nr:PhzF family phenazine biosynthesis protein [Syntrophales bacterium]
MKIPIYQIDAFTSTLFQGNPAAVCPLPSWLPDAVMQDIAAENNLSETAFLTGGDGCYELRWFTPRTEIDLCGHATLAAAFCVFSFLEPGLGRVTFYTKSGPLLVEAKDDILWMDFPSRPPQPCEAPAELYIGLMIKPHTVLRSRDYLAVYDKEEKVRDLAPRMDVLERCDCTGIIATAPGRDVDFVSRF